MPLWGGPTVPSPLTLSSTCCCPASAARPPARLPVQVKKIDIEAMPRSEEKEMFKEFMEEFNTATLPHRCALAGWCWLGGCWLGVVSVRPSCVDQRALGEAGWLGAWPVAFTCKAGQGKGTRHRTSSGGACLYRLPDMLSCTACPVLPCLQEVLRPGCVREAAGSQGSQEGRTRKGEELLLPCPVMQQLLPHVCFLGGCHC